MGVGCRKNIQVLITPRINTLGLVYIYPIIAKGLNGNHTPRETN